MLDADAIADIEGDVEAVFSLADLDPAEPTSMRRLFLALGLRPPEAASIRTEGAFALVGGEPRVFVRRGLSTARARWRIGHELGHWWLEHRAGRYVGRDLEARCDAFGAALCVPAKLLRRAVRVYGGDVGELAARLKVTQSLALLRIGEVCGEPAAVVRHRGALVRGADFVWPVSLDLASVKRTRHPGIRRVGIDDEPRRVGIVAA